MQLAWVRKFGKNWVVTDNLGKVEGAYRRRRNAEIFAREMNRWRHLFDWRVFTVKHRDT